MYRRSVLSELSETDQHRVRSFHPQMDMASRFRYTPAPVPAAHDNAFCAEPPVMQETPKPS
jgi:hypothetical protein